MVAITRENWKQELFPEVERKAGFVIDDSGEMIFPKIKIIKGNRVDSEGNLAWTYYDTNTIERAELGEIFEHISRELEPIYRRVHSAMVGYIDGHELNVEVTGKPGQDQRKHGRLEAQYLDSIEGTDEYIAGLALHKIRREKGDREGKWFTEYTNYFHDLDKKFEQYSAELDEMEGLVSDVIKGKPNSQIQTDFELVDNYRSDIYRSSLELDEVLV